MLAGFVNKIVPNVSPLQGNTIEDDERVSFGIVADTSVGNQIRSVEWTDSVIERCRFDSTTIVDSSFERVAFVDSDLSGVSFNNCLLRNCLILGVNAKFHFAFDNCILDRVLIARSRTDRFDIHNSRIANIEFLGSESVHLDFYQCQAHKRKGQLSFEECEMEKITGLEEISAEGVSVHLDTPMWRDLGDAYLKKRGFQPLESGAAPKYSLLDRMEKNFD